MYKEKAVLMLCIISKKRKIKSFTSLDTSKFQKAGNIKSVNLTLLIIVIKCTHKQKNKVLIMTGVEK